VSPLVLRQRTPSRPDPAVGGADRTDRSRARPRARCRDDGPEREAYETLGLDRTADGAAVKRAYRERAKRLHPDSDDGDEEAFKRLNKAYEVLTD